MVLELKLQQKMTQQLVMTPQLQQAIKLLQLSHLELVDALQKEIEENPVLEEGEGTSDEASEQVAGEQEPEASDDEAPLGAEDPGSGGDGAEPEPTASEVDREMDWDAYLESYSYSLPASAGAGGLEDLPPFEATLVKPASLIDHLRWQIQMGGFSQEEASIAARLIEEVNEDGYLAQGAVASVAEDLEVFAEQVELVLGELQKLDPLGVLARDLRECLLVQAAYRTREDPLVMRIIDVHLPNVEKRSYGVIAKDLGVSLEEVVAAVKVIAHLEPRPGRAYSDREPQYISPDIYVYKVGDDYVIQQNEDGLPRLRVSSYYRDVMASSLGNTKSYIQERLRSATWLIRSIHMRQRTIYRVMESILKFQRDFFDKGPAHLKPLILREVAADLDMHESTISRVTTNKYVHTPQGIYELKYFFNSSINCTGGDSIASESVRGHIQRLVDEEDPSAPYSDHDIVVLLKKSGIDIARRTVAKYREMLKIPSSQRRRKLY